MNICVHVNKKNKQCISKQKMEITNIPNHQNLHFILIPWLASGHMIPMIDIGRMLAGHGAAVTVITTPANAARIKPTIDRLSTADHSIKFAPLNFPAVIAGLPAGCENIGSVPSKALFPNFLCATKLFHGPVAQYLHNVRPRPSCIISGMGNTWTPKLAQEFRIPCFYFHGYCSFALLCCDILHKIYDVESPLTDPFSIPDLPIEFKIAKKQVPSNIQVLEFRKMMVEQIEAESIADGVIVNSFEELEPGYAELLRIRSGKMVQTIGPVSLCNTSKLDIEERGDKASINTNECMAWLDSKNPNSVIYVSFGSLGVFQHNQLMELGLGLLACKWSFIWVIHGAELFSAETKAWLHENFEARADRKCLLIRGWAPQVMILSHQAVGGFLTHCGWNSTLEGVVVGLPVATWPLFGEQFINEKLIIDVLRIGVRVGVESAMEWYATTNDNVAVRREDVTRALERLMDEGEERDEWRRRAKELGKKAKEVIEKGGSSYLNMTLLMQYVANYKGGNNA